MQQGPVPSQPSEPGPPNILCVDDVAQISWDDVSDVDALCLPQTSGDGHIEVICRIKGWALIDHHDHRARERVTRRHVEPSAIEAPAGGVQASVFDASDVAATDHGAYTQYFVRWEHLLYRTQPSRGSSLGDVLPRTVPLIHDLARAVGDKPLFLRLPDVRSDDPALARLFFDAGERNPALGVHGTRYLMANPGLLADLVALAADLPGNVALAAPFITNSREFFACQRAVGDTPLHPFVETPTFLIDFADYAGCPQVLIGMKDMTYLMGGLDRENPRLAAPRELYTEVVGALREPIARLTDGGHTVVSLTCTLKQYPSFAHLLHGVDWLPSLPAAMARRLAGHPRPGTARRPGIC